MLCRPAAALLLIWQHLVGTAILGLPDSIVSSDVAFHCCDTVGWQRVQTSDKTNAGAFDVAPF